MIGYVQPNLSIGLLAASVVESLYRAKQHVGMAIESFSLIRVAKDNNDDPPKRTNAAVF